MSAGQTVITYNGITITNCVTEQFSQEAVFDDSGTDLLFHKFTIEVTGFVTGLLLPVTNIPASQNRNSMFSTNFLSTLSPGDDGYPNPTLQEVAIRADLLEPRKEFVMRLGVMQNNPLGVMQNNPQTANPKFVDGTVLLWAKPYPPPAGPTSLPAWKSVSPASPGSIGQNTGSPVTADRSGYDLNNGPKCLSVSLHQITGNTIFHVRVRFEVCKLECDRNGQALHNNNGVLSNRWSVADDIDENFMTTRRFQGVLRVTTANLNAHEFRTLVVPPLQPGFYRKSMTFNVSEDGLKLAYSVIDRETVWSAPKPATKWHLNHKETSGGATGMTIGEATCELSGDRNTDDQRVLIKTAIAIVMSKLYFAGGNNAHIPEEMTVVTEYGNDAHKVSVYMRVSRVLMLHNFMGMMHETLGTGVLASDPNIAASPAAGYNPNLSRGSRPGDKIEVSGPITIATAWRAYLQSPCDEDHAIELARDAKPETPKPADTAYTLKISPASSIPDTPAGYISAEHQQFPYTYWEMQSLYDADQNNVALPIARSGQYLPQEATQAIVSLAPPTWKRIVRVSGTRVGKEPDLPKIPKTYTIPGPGPGRMAVLIGREKISAHPPAKTLDGKNLYRVDIDFQYALTHEPQPTDPLPIGFLPWQNNAVGYKLPATTFNVTSAKAGIS